MNNGYNLKDIIVDGKSKLFDDEEIHFDRYDTDLDNMQKFGERYLALQSTERSKSRQAGAPAE